MAKRPTYLDAAARAHEYVERAMNKAAVKDNRVPPVRLCPGCDFPLKQGEHSVCIVCEEEVERDLKRELRDEGDYGDEPRNENPDDPARWT